MKKISTVSASLLLSVLLSAVASTASAQLPAKEAAGVITTPSGMTLYTFDRDQMGASSCNAACATSWPPFAAKADDRVQGDYTVITRDDGSKQWALKGRALYTWSNDAKPGDKTGDGMLNNAWHAARP
ncbi:hypothetical protein ACFQAT_24025 [Undibacterium arcticum]|uniref:Lipoprotein with Yx(FWY)xxD motif n=1 Tax=Undibacterium arcticum TaxID=1762892 RepID=A0ABV7F114_9BURK